MNGQGHELWVRSHYLTATFRVYTDRINHGADDNRIVQLVSFRRFSLMELFQTYLP